MTATDGLGRMLATEAIASAAPLRDFWLDLCSLYKPGAVDREESAKQLV